MSFTNFFKQLGKFVGKAFSIAKNSGLTDDIVQIALPYVREANRKFVDYAQRREWVVYALVTRKVPERIARIAVELAYQIYREEIGKVGI
jgi:hypothetical protein